MNVEHIYTESERDFLLRIIRTKIAPILEDLAKGGLAYAWESWKNEVRAQRAVEAENKLLRDVKEVMRTSTRGQRTAAERDLIMQYVSKLSCIPQDTSHTAMDTLCNEIDFYPAIDAKSIMFLQGDFGNCYYIIAEGFVDLYLEQSKDKEMENGRTFGKHRGVSYRGDDFAGDLLKEVDETGKALKKPTTFLSATTATPHTNEGNEMKVSPVGTRSELGKKIVTLEAGRGFGEFAILSTAGKIRMCSAVAATENSFCLILHAATYNLVLRQHHYRASKLSAATALLKEMPVFNTYSHAKLSSIAYNMKSAFHQKTSVVVKAGDRIDKVLIVHTGTMRVLKERQVITPSAEGVDRCEPGETVPFRNAEQTLLRRLPRLAVSELGKGSVVGEWELLQGLRTFSSTYISNSHDCEVFEMPLSTYHECCTSTTISEHQQDLMKKKLTLAQHRDARIKGRLDRTEDRIKKIAVEFAKDKDDQSTLLRMLPLLIDGVTLEGGVGVAADAGRGGGDRGFKHRHKSSQDFISLHREIRAEAGETEAAPEDLLRGRLGADAAYGYDPTSSRNLEEAYRALPRTPSPTRGGRFRAPGSSGGTRGSSRGNRAPSSGPRGPTARGSTPGSPITALNLTLVNGGGSPASPMVYRAMSPPDSARSRPSPRASRVLCASSYRD